MKTHTLRALLFVVTLSIIFTVASASSPPYWLVSSHLDSRVLKYDANDGSFLGELVSARSGGLDMPTSTLIGPTGELYVGSNVTDSILRYDLETGAFIGTLVTSGSGGLDGPSSMVIGPDGYLYVTSSSNSNVLRYDATSGVFQNVFVMSGSGGLDHAMDLTFGPDGNLYVCSRSSNEVKRYDGQTGAFIDDFVSSGSVTGPNKMLFSPDGNLYVLGFYSHDVVRYNGNTGAYIDTFVPSNSGGLKAPHALALGLDGNLYVAKYPYYGDSSGFINRYNGTTGGFIDTFIPEGSGNLQGPVSLMLVSEPIIEDIVWILIDDPGLPGHEGFNGEMSKYETTNGQYCAFLNSAKAAGQIIVYNDIVYDPNDTSYAEPYFYMYATSEFSQITYSDGVFSVRSRDGYSMDNHPVVAASWYGAAAFCDYYGYRLPTEWEWQAVADYDGSYTYGCGMTISFAKANYYSGTHANPLSLSTHPYTNPVYYYPSYGYGMNDMAGNVWEWTSSWYSSEHAKRLVCGGSYGNLSGSCTVSYRHPDVLDSRSDGIGFRVCRDAPAPIDIVWVSVNDPGVPGHEAFSGEISKYETTNAQYCEFLNNALVSGDITEDVRGADGSNAGADFVGVLYYDLNGPGDTGAGATNGAAARINYSGGVFSVDNGYENHPVTYVSWQGATAFCNYYGYRLPTEWEWQAVADYDGSFIYGCGSTISPTTANYYDSTHPDGTTAVGTFSSYGYDMADMAGNAVEWTSSVSGAGSYHIICGGGWTSSSSSCSVSVRNDYTSDDAYYSIGFRAVRLRTLHVDAINGNDTNNGLSREDAFASIQAGINAAQGGETVLVWPGVYEETVDFIGKAITVQSAADAAVITSPVSYAVRFHTAEGDGSIIKNVLIRDSLIGIQAESSSPTIDHVTIVNSILGIVADGVAYPTISNSILWDNLSGDLLGCIATHSWLADMGDPCFVDPVNSDYHLKSTKGRFYPEDPCDPSMFGDADGLWTIDSVSSPCIDGGDPMAEPTGERMPNGGRVNMGAYGGTPYASMSEYALEGDTNQDGIVNLLDLAILSQNWLNRL